MTALKEKELWNQWSSVTKIYIIYLRKCTSLWTMTDNSSVKKALLQRLKIYGLHRPKGNLMWDASFQQIQSVFCCFSCERFCNKDVLMQILHGDGFKHWALYTMWNVLTLHCLDCLKKTAILLYFPANGLPVYLKVHYVSIYLRGIYERMREVM